MQKAVFPLFGYKTCSRGQFRCFGSKKLKREFSHFLGPKRAQEWSFAVLGSKTFSRVEFRCFAGPKGAQQVSFALLGSEHSILQIWDSKTFRPLFHLFLRLWGLYLAVWSENDPFGLISH